MPARRLGRGSLDRARRRCLRWTAAGPTALPPPMLPSPSIVPAGPIWSPSLTSPLPSRSPLPSTSPRGATRCQPSMWRAMPQAIPRLLVRTRPKQRVPKPEPMCCPPSRVGRRARNLPSAPTVSAPTVAVAIGHALEPARPATLRPRPGPVLRSAGVQALAPGTGLARPPMSVAAEAATESVDPAPTRRAAYLVARLLAPGRRINPRVCATAQARARWARRRRVGHLPVAYLAASRVAQATVSARRVRRVSVAGASSVWPGRRYVPTCA